MYILGKLVPIDDEEALVLILPMIVLHIKIHTVFQNIFMLTLILYSEYRTKLKCMKIN